jgi:hypothetical protein
MPLTKVCCKCKLELDASGFYKNRRMKDGLNTFCIDCHKADNTARKAVNRSNPEFRNAELEYKKTYRERTVEERALYMNRWREQNADHIREYEAQYRNANRTLINYHCNLRKIVKIQRTPAWLTEEDHWMMEQAYELASLRTKQFGFAWHVDHKLPLRGKLVSGLHAPNNLQVIPAKQNLKKSNAFEV